MTVVKKEREKGEVEERLNSELYQPVSVQLPADADSRPTCLSRIRAHPRRAAFVPCLLPPSLPSTTLGARCLPHSASFDQVLQSSRASPPQSPQSMAKKRRASPVRDADASPPKRRARQRDVVVVPDSDEEPLDDILAKIKAQEESEALASRLASASQTYGETSQMGQRTQDEPMVTDDTVESDEALARRLAAEWAAEEAELVVPIESQPSVPGSSRRASAAAGPSTSDGGGIAANDCATDTVPDVKLRTHEELFVGTRKCTKCNVDVASPRGYVRALYHGYSLYYDIMEYQVTFTSGQLPPPSLVVLLHATCQSCKAVHCRGCFKLLSCQPRCKGTKNNEQCPVLTCCAEVRAIALFEALGGFDRQYLGERATSDTRSKEAAAKYRKSTVNSVGPGGTGYGTGASTSYYYGGPTHGGYDDYDDEWDAFNNFPGSKRRGRGGGHQRGRGQSSTAVALANHWDELLVRALSTITALLPSPYSDDAQVYDMLPHSSITQLLALSQLPELLASLLRNDSITDWTTRSDLYNAMLTLLRRMADCELTLEACNYNRVQKFLYLTYIARAGSHR